MNKKCIHDWYCVMKKNNKCPNNCKFKKEKEEKDV